MTESYSDCPECGSRELNVFHRDCSFPHDTGAGFVMVDAFRVPIVMCENCGLEIITSEGLLTLNQASEATVRERLANGDGR